MTKLYRIFKTQLLVAVVLFGASMGFAQVVQVPSNCTVIIAGTGVGAVTGPGGKVGNNGMVTMPDALVIAPFTTNQGGVFTFIPSTVIPAITTASWNLKGDISNTKAIGNVLGVSGNYNTVTQPAAGLTANIFSYNKFYRASSTEATNASLARSKGQVRVSYVQAPCNNSIVFDIFKTFDKAPDIVGPSCLKPNTLYTYSVDRIVSDNPNDNIGFDSYYWSLPVSAYTTGTFYTSADTSSITFTTGASVAGFTLQCCLGRVNSNTADGGPSSVNLAVTPARTVCTTKTIITAPNPVISVPGCVPTGTVAAPAIFTIQYPNVVSGTTYTWTAANTGWGGPLTSTFTPVVNSPVAGQTTLTINTLGNNNPGELTLTITGPCDPAIFKYQINRNIASPIAVKNTFVSATPFCLAGTSTGNTYTLQPTTSSNILWTTDPATVTGVTLQNATTATVTVVTASAPVSTFKLVATATGTCNTTNVFETINIRPGTPSFPTTTPSCVVRNATVSTIGVTAVTGAVYDWTPLPAGVNISANPTTANPTFVFNGTGASSTLTVKVTGANGCDSASVTKQINYIQVATSAPGNGFADTYLVNGLCGAVTSWDISTTPITIPPTPLVYTNYTATSGNVTITNSGVGTNNSCAISGTAGLQITAVCANLPGNIRVCAATLGSLTQRLANTSSNGTIKETIEGVSVYPNPNNGVFFVKVEAIKQSATAVLNDFNGKEVGSYILKKGNNKLGNEELPKGTYFIVLTIDGKQETRQIVIR